MEMAETSRSSHMKAEWLTLAMKWLSLIPPEKGGPEMRFDDMLRDKGTGQKGSTSAH